MEEKAEDCFKVAADYLIMAFREEKTIHFKEKSIAKKAYLLMTNPLYINIIVIFSWAYIFLTFLEPGNHVKRPFEPSSRTFQVVSLIEFTIQTVFFIDTCI